MTTKKIRFNFSGSLDISFDPEPPQNLSYSILKFEENMKKARVKLTWTPSASQDVTEQRLAVTVTPEGGPAGGVAFDVARGGAGRA